MIKPTKSTPATTTTRSARALDTRALRDVRGGVYQKIEWTYEGNATPSDDWESRV